LSFDAGRIECVQLLLIVNDVLENRPDIGDFYDQVCQRPVFDHNKNSCIRIINDQVTSIAQVELQELAAEISQKSASATFDHQYLDVVAKTLREIRR
jgi:hypothetical protein